MKLDRLTAGRSVILRLVTIGALVTWLIGWATTLWLFEVSSAAAALIGAILVVSGPTVVIDSRRRFYPPAAVALGIDPGRLVIVRPQRQTDEIWALDQASRCADVAAVLWW